MKKCGYCGKEYGDEAAFCSIDGQPLKSGPAQRRTPLRGSSRLWSGVGIGVCCAIIGGILVWQRETFMNDLGKGIIGFGTAWIISAVQDAKRLKDLTSKQKETPDTP